VCIIIIGNENNEMICVWNEINNIIIMIILSNIIINVCESREMIVILLLNINEIVLMKWKLCEMIILNNVIQY